MERGKLWVTAFRTNLGILERNLPGLTDELAAARPAPGLASPAWLMGHILRGRHRIIELCGGSSIPPEFSIEAYGRGSDGASAHLSLSDLAAACQATDAPLKDVFRALEDWDRITMNPGLQIEQPLEQVIAFLHWHESYHLGQIAWARKLVGLGGAF
jgi:uncharacterized damage-inducible protein DinB